MVQLHQMQAVLTTDNRQCVLLPLGASVLIGCRYCEHCCHGHLGRKLWVGIPIAQEIICAPL